MNLNDVLNLYSTQFFWLCDKIKEEEEIRKKEMQKAKRKKKW